MIEPCGHVCAKCLGCEVCCGCFDPDAGVPSHNWLMPHFMNKTGVESCPPNCPYRKYFEEKE